METLHPNRKEIVEIFRKFSIHRGMRLNMMHDLIDEINDYYESKYITRKGHSRILDMIQEQKLEKLGEFLKLMSGTSDYAKGVQEGVKKCIEIIRKA